MRIPVSPTLIALLVGFLIGWAASRGELKIQKGESDFKLFPDKEEEKDVESIFPDKKEEDYRDFPDPTKSSRDQRKKKDKGYGHV